MRAYREFLPTAPEELGIFVGLKTVPPTDPFPRDYWSKRACALVSSYNGPAAEGEQIMAQAAQDAPAADLQLDGRDAVPGDPGAVRSIFPDGPAVVLEG